MSRATVAGALLCAALLPGLARAGAPERQREDAGQEVASARGREPGSPQAAPPTTSEEDREVIENLDLLQAMDGARDLDLLLELNQEKDGE